MGKQCIAIVLCLFLQQISSGQSYDYEALQYSQYERKGTARSAAVGGAFCAVGADAGAIAINPAGLAMFRSSEVSGSINLMNTGSKTDFLNSSNKDNKFRFIGQQLAIVLASKLSGSRGGTVKGFGLSFSLDRVADFNNSIYFKDRNDTNSVTDQYLIIFNSPTYRNVPIDYNNFPMDFVLASESQLVSYDPIRNFYTSSVTVPVIQSGSIFTRGGITDMALSGGVNLWDKLYLGASVGFPFMLYKRSYNFTEQDAEGINPTFNKSSYNQEYASNGIGFVGKLGVIYKPHQWFRVGASIATPTFMALRETFSGSMDTEFDTATYRAESPNGAFEYSLTQPFRFNTGVAVFFDKYGFFSADYELTDYRRNKYNFGVENADFAREINDSMKTAYKTGHTIRTGIEGAWKSLRVRGGYSYSFTPYQEGQAQPDYNQIRQLYSAGLGYKGKRLSVDLAYVRSTNTYYYEPYFSIFSYGNDAIKSKTHKDQIMLTVGFKLAKQS